MHFAYELMVDNPSHFFITLDMVEAVDEAGNSLGSMEGDALAAMTKPFSANDPLPPGGLAAVFMDVSFGPDETLPDTVFARLTVTRQAIGEDGKPAPLPASSPVPATVTFTGAPTAIGAPAVVVAPPLSGKGWIAVNGCCDAITSHRGAIMAVSGQLRVPERFAIDWVKLDDGGRISGGDGKTVEDYGYYGAPVLAVADGVVVNLYDEADAQVPGEITGITTENIGGNMIVTDIGGGNFAFYAHLQRGSLEVGLGDQVTAGQQIALLGNTGNTDAPHLHFHVMDGPSPLDANGLPYVFTGFETDAAHLAGSFTDALPLNDQVVDFN